MLHLKGCDSIDSLWHWSLLASHEHYKLAPSSAGSLHVVNRLWCTVSSGAYYKLWISSVEIGKGLCLSVPSLVNVRPQMLVNASLYSMFSRQGLRLHFGVSCSEADWVVNVLQTNPWCMAPLAGTVSLPAAAPQWHEIHAEELKSIVSYLCSTQIEQWAERSLAWSCWTGGSESPRRWANLAY